MVVQILNGMLVLAAVSILAYLALRLGASKLRGRIHKGTGRMQVIDKLDLGSQRSLIITRVMGRTFLLGMSEAGIFNLAKLDGTGADDTAFMDKVNAAYKNADNTYESNSENKKEEESNADPAL